MDSADISSPSAAAATTSTVLRKGTRGSSLINHTAVDFQQLIINHGIIVDRTHLIKRLIDNDFGTNILLTLPTGVGKTMVLSMLDYFVKCNHVLAGNAKQFKDLFNTDFRGRKLAVAEDKAFTDEHQGKHPTIYLRLSNVGKGADTKKELNETLRKLFLDNKNNLFKWKGSQKIDKWKKDEFNKYCDEMDGSRWETGVQFLLELLYERYDQKTIIMIDDYDAAITNCGFLKKSDPWKSATALVSKFIGVFESAQYVRLLLVVGTYRFLADSSKLKWYGKGSARTSTDKQLLAQYFGFTTNEFYEMCNAYEFPESLHDSAKYFYNGQTICGVDRFNSHSLMRLLVENYLPDQCEDSSGQQPYERLLDSNESLPAYFKKSTFIANLEPLFRVTSIKNIIERLLCGGEKYTMRWSDLNQPFEKDDALQLLRLVRLEIETIVITASDERLFMRFLHASGYLVWAQNELRIPNGEINHFLKTQLQRYYEQLYAFDIVFANEVTDSIGKLLVSKDQQQEKLDTLKQAFKELLEAVLTKEGTVVDRNEHHVHMLFEFAAIRYANWKYFAGDYVMKDDTKNRRPDLIISHSQYEKAALCIEFKWKTTIKKALFQLAKENYLTLSALTKIDSLERIMAMGVSVNPKNKVTMELRETDRKQNETSKEMLVRFEHELLAYYASN